MRRLLPLALVAIVACGDDTQHEEPVDRDDDGDGILNSVEIDLGTDIFNPDSDGDGIGDLDELDPGFIARDSDGDGRIDALESAIADADVDCLVDQDDPANETPDLDDPRVLAFVDSACPEPRGVCSSGLAVQCIFGEPNCIFDHVAGYEPNEITCDALDNDCDGDTDEAVECQPGDPLLDELVAHWPLDGDGDDDGPYSDEVTLVGVTPALDRFNVAGKALRFASDADRVVAEHSHQPRGDESFTWAMWVKPAPPTVARVTLLRASGLTFGLEGAQNCMVLSGTTDAHATRGCAPSDHWSLLAVVKQGNDLRFYLNGRESYQVGDAVAAIEDGRLEFGEGFRGLLDDVRIWSRALTPNELALLYHANGWADVGTPSNPAASCLHVHDGGASDAVDGRYVLDPLGTPFEATCDLATAGGGWTLVWRYRLDSGAITPRGPWPAGGEASASAPTATTFGSIPFAAWHELGTDLLLDGELTERVTCTSFGGSLSDALSGSVFCTADTSCGTLPTRLEWTNGPTFVGASTWASLGDAPAFPCADEGDGEVWLRPAPVEPPYPASCADVAANDRTRTSARIAPDPAAPSFRAECLHSAERGGWTQLTQRFADAIDGPRDYLLEQDGHWYRSPVTTAAWDWEHAATVSGLWVYEGADVSASACAGEDAGGWGVGCGVDDEVYVRPGLRDGATQDVARGLTTVCASEGVFASECVDGVSVWMRPRRCVADAGSLLADGGFDAFDADSATSCWTPVSGAVTVGPSHDDATALALPSPSEVLQGGLTFLAGRAYRVTLWARADVARHLSLFVHGSALIAQHTVALDPIWRQLEVSFVAHETTFDGYLDLLVTGDVAGAVAIDDVTLVDIGADPCTTVAPELVADGGFDAGLTCWSFSSGTLTQAVALAPERHYRLSLVTHGGSARFVPVMLDGRLLDQIDVGLDARSFTTELVTRTVGAAPTLQLALDPSEVDDVSLEDLGPSPCIPPAGDLVADGGFTLGTTCWREPTDFDPLVRTLRQAQLPLVADHHYRLAYTASGTGPLSSSLLGDRSVALGDAKRFEHYLVSATTAEATLSFVVPSGAELDDAALEDLGTDPCPVSEALVNGDFSDGAMCWTSPVMLHPEDGALRVEPVEDTSLTTEVVLESGWYRVSFRARDPLQRSLALTVAGESRTFFINEEWQSYGFDFVHASSGPETLRFDFLRGDAVFIDDVHLERMGDDPCSGAMVRDGGFDAGPLCWLASSPAATYTASDEHALETTAPSLAITNNVPNNQPLDVRLGQGGFAVVAGERYTLRFWAKAESARDLFIVLADYTLPELFVNETVTLGSSWSMKTFDFVAAVDSVDVRLDVYLGGVGGTTWIDGVSLGLATQLPIPMGGLIAYYPFDGDAHDASGHGNDGQSLGGFPVNDRFGVYPGAYEFDGVSAHVTAPLSGAPLGNADRTITFWLSARDGGPQCGITGSSIVSYGADECTGHVFGAGYCNYSYAFWGGCLDRWPADADAPLWQEVTPFVWTFYAIRHRAGEMTVRIDDASEVWTTTLDTHDGLLRIGAETVDGSSYRSGFWGSVDDVRVYDRALDDLEIQALRQETHN